MTTEQAINELKDWQTAFSHMDKDMSYAIEALSMAIEALSSSEPKTADSGSADSEIPEAKTDRTTSGDLISRQDAVKVIKKMAWENDNKFGNARNILLDGAKELDSLPSVQPEQQWINVMDNLVEEFKNNGGDSYFIVDGEEYRADTGYAMEGIELFVEKLKERIRKQND